MTAPAFSRFFSLGCSISRLTCASDSSPLMASTEWPKPTSISTKGSMASSGKWASQPSVSPWECPLAARIEWWVGSGGRCRVAGCSSMVRTHQTISITTITVVTCMMRIAFSLDSCMPWMFCHQK